MCGCKWVQLIAIWITNQLGGALICTCFSLMVPKHKEKFQIVQKSLAMSNHCTWDRNVTNPGCRLCHRVFSDAMQQPNLWRSWTQKAQSHRQSFCYVHGGSVCLFVANIRGNASHQLIKLIQADILKCLWCFHSSVLLISWTNVLNSPSLVRFVFRGWTLYFLCLWWFSSSSSKKT